MFKETDHDVLKRNILFHWLPLFIYCALIFIQSSYPGLKQIPQIPFMDKYLHFIGYAILGILFFRAYMTLKFRDRLLLVSLLSIGSSTLYGISDEIHQYYVPYRNADVMDAVANFAGSCMGVFFYYLLIKRYEAIFSRFSWNNNLKKYL